MEGMTMSYSLRRHNLDFMTALLVALLLWGVPATAADFTEEDEVVIFEREQDVDPSGQPLTPFPGRPLPQFIFEEIYRTSHIEPKQTVLVLVNADIVEEIQPALDRYLFDLEDSGYAVVAFQSSGGSPEDLKAEIASIYSGLTTTGGLVGAVLVGKLPVPWFEMDDDFYGRRSEFPIDLYYMDLDGDWIDSDTDGMFDLHTDGQGDQAPEIWMGRLTAGPLDGDEADLLNSYFAKNHEYRIGNLPSTGKALAYVDDDWWYFNDANLSLAYEDVTVVNDPFMSTADDYRDRLTQDFEWVHVMAHSWPRGHHFKVPSDSGGFVTYDEVRDIDASALFYNLFACSNARYIENNYMGGWYIFSAGNGLAAVGSTKTGSMLAFSEFYRPFGQGRTLGDSYKEWFVSRAPYNLSDRRWYYGMTLLGDPTLRKRVTQPNGDLDRDGDVDRDDLNIILAARNTPASGPDDPRDLDGDGMITMLDTRKLVLLCTRSRCAT